MIKEIKNFYEKKYSKVRTEALEKNVSWRNVVVNTLQISLMLGVVCSIVLLLGFSTIVVSNRMQDTFLALMISYIMMPMPLILGVSIFFYAGSAIAKINILFFHLLGKGIQAVYNKYFMNHWKKNKQDPKIFTKIIEWNEKFNRKYSKRQRKFILVIPEIILLIIILYPRVIPIVNQILSLMPVSQFGIHW